MIDLRSDTVTQPTPAMRQAMADAAVGDDVFGDDPTLNALEAYVADLLGKEEAVFMPSGTMTNQVALRVHTEPGDEIILEAEAHVYYYEGGAPAALSGVMCRLIKGDRGMFTAEDVRRVLRSEDVHYPKTKLVCLENTHNRGGGKIFPLGAIQEIAHLCREHDLMLHLDGARFWNACIAAGISEADYAKPFDTLSVCFSKGLGAPIGSALVGSHDLMKRARRFRKMFGGAMRQVGIVAAGALYALDHHRERLAEDHENAKLLAHGLSQLDEIDITPDAIETNIIMFRSPTISAHAMVERLNELDVALLPTGAHSYRAVTNLMVTQEQVLDVPSRVKAAIASLQTVEAIR
ncbi:MAG: low-specificity L-threonine aldolase [Elainellaceae cyanobacterium]